MYYVVETSATKEVLEQFVREGANLITLETILTWEKNGILQVRNMTYADIPHTDDQVVQLCRDLQEKEGIHIELLSNDLLVHLKTQYNGIHATTA